MGLPFLSFDATSISETGYRGRDAVEMVKDLVHRCNVKKAAHGIIFLNEIDKIAARKDNEYRAAYCRGTQYSLLKRIEGTEVEVDGDIISTGGILFLFGGAFSDLTRKKPTISRKAPIGFEREEIREEVRKNNFQNLSFRVVKLPGSLLFGKTASEYYVIRTMEYTGSALSHDYQALHLSSAYMKWMESLEKYLDTMALDENNHEIWVEAPEYWNSEVE